VKAGSIAIAAVAVISFLYLIYMAMTFEAPAGTTTVIIPAPQSEPLQRREPPVRPMPSPPQVETPARVDVAEQPAEIAPEPVEVEIVSAVEAISERIPQAAQPAAALPRLGESDGFVISGLQAIRNGTAMLRFLAQDQMVRKFVVYIENISRGQFPQSELPYNSIGQEMPVRNVDEGLFIMEAVAHERFDDVVNTLIALDAEQAMAFYRVLSPLFQQAFAEIGFRDKNFDTVLRQAITNVLQTSDVAGPYQLLKPSVMYVYADASIENLDQVQKQMIRIGPENSENLKAKLRQFLLLL